MTFVVRPQRLIGHQHDLIPVLENKMMLILTVNLTLTTNLTSVVLATLTMKVTVANLTLTSLANDLDPQRELATT